MRPRGKRLRANILRDSNVAWIGHGDSDLPETLIVAQPPALADAFVDGFRRAILVAAGLALLSAVAAAVLIEGKRQP
jgi:hypothetical protein